jgi:hypothetical protein
MALKRSVIELSTLGLHDRVNDLARSEVVDVGIRLQNRASTKEKCLINGRLEFPERLDGDDYVIVERERTCRKLHNLSRWTRIDRSLNPAGRF